MKRAALALGALLLGSNWAGAADLPVRAAPPPLPFVPLPTWTGFYFGANAGAIMDDSRTQLTPSGDFLTPAFAATNSLRSPAFKLDRTEGIGGGQVGYNLQFGSFVIGVETDFGKGITRRENLNVAALPTPLIGSFTGTVNSQVDYVGTVRGRVGYAWDRLLVYGTGGFAYGRTQTQTDVVFSSAGDRYVGTFHDTQTGYAYGGGAEYMLTDMVSVRAEYLHVDLGSVRSTSQYQPVAPTFSYDTRLKNAFDIARAGINFRFNWF